MYSKKNCIGIMSGTSLDGLDIAFCEFIKHKTSHNYIIKEATTIKYDNFWKNKFNNASSLCGLDLIKLDNEFGLFIGDQINLFLKNLKIQPEFIASHGHTVFHQPENQLTLQIGNGAQIAATTGITTISNFRALDIALGGQGAPLVPIGDKYLFGKYDSCLNLGGIANISFELKGKRIAFDICPVNIVINKLVSEIGLEYDKDGKIASRGEINQELLDTLEKLEYYFLPFPKSLGKEWIDSQITPILNKCKISIEDKLRTIYEHISNQLTKVFLHYKIKNVLITGGGAYNQFLLRLIKNKTNSKIIIPDNKTIEYKEALIFAFLGLLRINNEKNCLSSVTGASCDCSGGTVFYV